MEMTTSNVVRNLLSKYQALSENTVTEQVTYEFDEFGGHDNIESNQLEQIQEEEDEEEKNQLSGS